LHLKQQILQAEGLRLQSNQLTCKSYNNNIENNNIKKHKAKKHQEKFISEGMKASPSGV
jgi:hypothetical protein